MLNLTVQFITRDVMSKRLTEEIAQFSQIFTPDFDLCKSFYFSLIINYAVSSVNRSITCDSQATFYSRKLRRKLEDKLTPSIHIIVQFFAGAKCTVKLRVYILQKASRQFLSSHSSGQAFIMKHVIQSQTYWDSFCVGDWRRPQIWNHCNTKCRKSSMKNLRSKKIVQLILRGFRNLGECPIYAAYGQLKSRRSEVQKKKK